MVVDFCWWSAGEHGCYQTVFYTIAFHSTKSKKRRKYIPAVFY